MVIITNELNCRVDYVLGTLLTTNLLMKSHVCKVPSCDVMENLQNDKLRKHM